MRERRLGRDAAVDRRSFTEALDPVEIETDGSVEPRTALSSAAETLIKRLGLFADPEQARTVGEEAEDEAPAGGGMNDILIEELELGVRSYNCLKRVGIETIGDLVMKSENELAAIPNFGKKSIEEVKETLATHGLRLRGDNGNGGVEE